MDQILSDLVGRFGYLIVFLGVGIESMGIPVPGETALVVGAVFAQRGQLDIWVVGVVGFAGAVGGDNLGYYVGRRWGRRLTSTRVGRLLYDERRLAVADRHFARHGMLTVFLGRFVALLRIFMGPLAGMHGMPWPHFLVANAAGAVLWVSTIVLVGWLIGDNLGRAISLVTRMGYAGLALAVVVAAVVVGLHMRRTRRERAEGQRLLAESRERDGDGGPAPR